jgi:hypothetical protein
LGTHLEVARRYFQYKIFSGSLYQRFGIKGKLAPRFIQSFEILEKVGPMAYRLALPPQLVGVHNVFHVSMLRKYYPDPNHVIDWNQFNLKEDVSYDEQPVQILDRKVQKPRNKETPLVKVKWQFHGDKELT